MKLKDYSPSEGTVLIWFRNPAYADALLEILGGEEEEKPPLAPDEVGSTVSSGKREG